MSQKIQSGILTYRASIALGAVIMFILTAVGISLLFRVGADSRDLTYKASYSRELERKVASLGGISAQGLAALKDLDMPAYGKTKATLKQVNLFDRVFSKHELCLAQAVYFEARGEPLIGQVAIAEVVLNRVANPKYPATVCEVVFQNQKRRNRCQFSFACDGKSDRPRDLAAWERSLKVVALVMAGERSGVAKKATHYHASYVTPRWSRRLSKVGEVGRHIFYRAGHI